MITLQLGTGGKSQHLVHFQISIGSATHTTLRYQSLGPAQGGQDDVGKAAEKPQGIHCHLLSKQHHMEMGEDGHKLECEQKSTKSIY